MNPVSANPTGNFNPQSRNASTLLIEDTVNWLKGKHSISMGGSWTQYDLWIKNQQLVPNADASVGNGDPALAMFGPRTSRARRQTQLTAAQSLYAILTGRVTSIAAQAALAKTVASTNTLATRSSARACGKLGSSSRTRGASGRT